MIHERLVKDSRPPSSVLDGDNVDIGITPSIMRSIGSRRGFKYPVTLADPFLRLGPGE